MYKKRYNLKEQISYFIYVTSYSLFNFCYAWLYYIFDLNFKLNLNFKLLKINNLIN